MARETILIIEDDEAMLRGLQDNFEFKGFRVETAMDGEKGLEAALRGGHDLIVLDIMLPSMNGYEVCERIRRAGMDMPIIMLTAKGQEEDIVRGLNLGADDYVTKPFSIKELLARADAFLRRRRAGTPESYRFGSLTLDLVSHRLLRGDEEDSPHAERVQGVGVLPAPGGPGPDKGRDHGRGLGPGCVRHPKERGPVHRHAAGKD